MRSSRAQSDHPPGPGTIAQDPGKASITQCDPYNPYWKFPEVCIQSTRSWGSISADVVNRTAGKTVWRSDCHRIIYALTDVPGTHRNDDGPPQDRPLLRDEFSFHPSGVTLESTVEAPVRFVQIVQRCDIYNNIVSEMVRGGAVYLEPRTRLHDPLVSQIALTIANEMQLAFADHILVDALSTALAVRIIRRHVDPTAITLAPPNGLSRERVQRVREYVEAHLDDRLTLSDLADVACLSPCHFSRSFKLAFRIGPQRYVMLRRLERAKTLLRQGNQPLAWVAQEAGFCDQSHLTSAFRRETGLTPGQFRAANA